MEIVEMVMVIRNRWTLTNPVNIVEIVEMVVMVEAIRNGWQPISPVEIVEMVEVICNRCQPISQVEIVEIGDIVEMTGAATQPLAAQHQSGNSENSGNGGDDTQSLLAYHTSGNSVSDGGYDIVAISRLQFFFFNYENAHSLFREHPRGLTKIRKISITHLPYAHLPIKVELFQK